MTLLEKMQTFLMLAAIALGLVTGRFVPWAAGVDIFITPALMCMLFGLFLGISLSELKRGFLDVKFTAVSLTVNFVWIPLLGWGLGGIFLADAPALRLGYLMLLVTPCTDWYLVFTAIARGNVPLSAAILPLNLIIQVILLPFYLLLFSGLAGRLELEPLLRSVLLVLALPFGLAQAFRNLLPEGGGFRRALAAVFSGGQFWFLCAAIWAMFASQSGYLSGHEGVFLKLLAPVLLFFIVNFVVVRLAVKVLKFSFTDSVSLSLTTLARNSPISLAIAVTAFPDEPLIALALVIGPLMELPFLGLVSWLLLWMRPKDENASAYRQI